MTILSVDESEAIQLLSTERKQSIRLNTLRADTHEEHARPSWLGAQYPWFHGGFELTLPVSAMRDDPLITSGEYFIQNAASWLPVIALEPEPGELILDVCAAPGGKTSHIAAQTNNQAIIWANDNSRARLAKLQSNMERLGARIEQYTLYDATQLAHRLDGQQFDKILLDAPCSGEGLMSIQQDRDLATWSVAHIKRLQQLQKRILTQAWRLLRPGGTLVYSTCTMAPEENEAVIDYLLRSQEDARVLPVEIELPNRVPTVSHWNNKAYSPETRLALRLKPSPNIEAFFVCKLRKLASSNETMV